MRALNRRQPLLAGVVAVLVAEVALGACERLKRAAREEIEQQVVGTPPSSGNDDEGNGQGGTMLLNSVRPNRGSILGHEIVEVIGTGFLVGNPAQVRFGAVEVEPGQVEVLSDTRLQCLLPPRGFGTAGVVDVLVAQGQSIAILEGGFEYFTPVTLTAVTPARGPASGGVELKLEGEGFTSGSRVTFGSLITLEARLEDERTLYVTAPPLGQGTYAVTVANLNGADALPAAFSVYEDLRVFDVVPVAAPTCGGTTLIVRGTGFVEGTSLRIAGHEQVATPNDQETELGTLLALPSGLPEGAVDVEVSNDNASVGLQDALVLYDASNTGPRITAILPNASLVDGGVQVHVVGAGFADGETTVHFGDQAASCDVVDDHLIVCVAPGGEEGPVDVRVANAGMDVVTTNGFLYLAMGLDVILPVSGAVAGGTFVRLFGHGFAGEDTQVLFGGQQATGVTVLSGGEEIRAFTPAHPAGPVPVTIRSRGVSVTADGLFTYVEPFSPTARTGGGPIEGAVNVTVYSSDGGGPVEGAFVMLAGDADPNTDHTLGLTDANGQITLSGPNVWGPQDVHAVKEGYNWFSWIRVNARNVIAFIGPLLPPPPTPLPDCPIPDPPDPPDPDDPPPDIDDPDGDPNWPPRDAALLRGVVSRIKDDCNTGHDTVVVTTSSYLVGLALPNPGPGAQVLNQGPFEIFARSGDVVVLALSGELNAAGGLAVCAMGFHPFVYGVPSSRRPCTDASDCPFAERCETLVGGNKYCLSVVEGVDVVIDRPLKQAMRIEFKDAPLGLETDDTFALPTQAYVTVDYDFAHMGVYRMATINAPTSDGVVYVNMPESLPDELGWVTFRVRGRLSGSSGAGGYTWSETFVEGLQDTSEVVMLAPMLQVYRETKPVIDEEVTGVNRVSIDPLPALDAPVRPSWIAHRIYSAASEPVCITENGEEQKVSVQRTYYRAMTPGDVTTFVFPTAPAAAGISKVPLGPKSWSIQAIYVPGGDFNNYSTATSANTKSSSGRTTRFKVVEDE